MPKYGVDASSDDQTWNEQERDRVRRDQALEGYRYKQKEKNITVCTHLFSEGLAIQVDLKQWDVICQPNELDG
ncbi:hypothetical protein ACJX0J_033376, partial [Zea mays]